VIPPPQRKAFACIGCPPSTTGTRRAFACAGYVGDHWIGWFTTGITAIAGRSGRYCIPTKSTVTFDDGACAFRPPWRDDERYADIEDEPPDSMEDVW
jgi:hypothetical protein